MFRLAGLPSIVATLLALAGPVSAGPVRDFETAMRSAYADYRAALFQTNSNNRDGALKAIGSFKQKWTALMDANAVPPPQYADDPTYTATLAKVAALTATAAAETTDGKLAEAHETLEGIRDQIGGLHQRNGLIGYSDRMNAYHAKMETVLSNDYAGFSAAGLGELRDDAAVLAYLAADLAAHPPAESSDPAYGQLLAGVTASVGALHKAASSGDVAAAKQAVRSLKPAYAKLFLKFG